MAALNIANELLKDRRKEPGSDHGLLDRVRGLRERVESAITRGKQLEI
jgi:cell division protein ZapA (FtsZ GTPase activity inhibitor)